MPNSKSNGPSNQHRKLIVAAVIALLAVGAFFAWPDALQSPGSPEPQAESQPDPTTWPVPASLTSASHKRMIDELAEIARATAEENIWLGDKNARKLRADLASLPADTSHAILGGLKSKLTKAE